MNDTLTIELHTTNVTLTGILILGIVIELNILFYYYYHIYVFM